MVGGIRDFFFHLLSRILLQNVLFWGWKYGVNSVSLLVGFCLSHDSHSRWAQVSASLLPIAFSSVRQGNPTHMLLRFCCGLCWQKRYIM